MVNPQPIAYIVQYFLLVIILISVSTKKIRINQKDIYILSLLIILAVISSSIGLYKGLNLNVRPFINPILFLIIINSKKFEILKYLFVYCAIVTITEYILYYFYTPVWKTIERFFVLRPWGGFLDMHLNGLFLAICLFLFGYRYFGWMIGAISMSLQTPITTLPMLISKRYLIILPIIVILIVVLLYYAGHLSLQTKNSMINAYLSIFNYKFDICLLVGCNSNDIKLTLINNTLGVVEDNGFVRVFYLFGIPWLFVYIYFVFSKSRSYVVPLAYLLTIIHYPSGFGLLGTALMALSINYYNYNVALRYPPVYCLR